jgi:hypothetical protein
MQRPSADASRRDDGAVVIATAFPFQENFGASLKQAHAPQKRARLCFGTLARGHLHRVGEGVDDLASFARTSLVGLHRTPSAICSTTLAEAHRLRARPPRRRGYVASTVVPRRPERARDGPPSSHGERRCVFFPVHGSRPESPRRSLFYHLRAARDYGRLQGYPAASDLERERTELAQLATRARPLLRERNGLEVWGVVGFDERPHRLLVGEPAVRWRGAKPALVQVLIGGRRAKSRQVRRVNAVIARRVECAVWRGLMHAGTVRP